jgi:hypothetical protein
MLTRPAELKIDLPLEEIARVCQKYGVSHLAIIGSVLLEDFDPARSDIDFLVRFINNDAGGWGVKFMDMEEELGAILGRDVDVVDWRAVEKSRNPIRRDHILRSAQLMYEAG